MILNYTKIKSDGYITIRNVLSSEFHISYTLRLRLKKSNKIFVNDKNTYLDYVLKNGDEIKVNLDFEEDNSNIVPTKMKLNILYEDAALLIVNKPTNMAVHPSVLHFNDSLSNGVKFYFDTINLKRKIRPVNRLDRDTSGIVIFAKNEYVHSLLSKQMEDDKFQKEYIAICEGAFQNAEGTINAPIARKENSIIERCIAPDGQNAITNYKVIKEATINGLDTDEKCKYSEVCIKLETGRTHQIRVHMAYIGHPILGDSLYGHPSKLIDRQALHSYKVQFIHPITKKQMVIVAEIPKDMQIL